MTKQDGISGLRVLVVEDDYWVAATLVEIITEAGAELSALSIVCGTP